MGPKHSRHFRTVGPLVALVVVMLGLTFASAPLYRLFCQVTGFAGTPKIGGQPSFTATDVAQDKSRALIIQFNADVSPDLSWQFHPEQRGIPVHVGRPFLIYYDAKNIGDRPITGTATFNVTPLKVAKYFHKIECFCFKEQMINPGASKKFPVSFYVDPALLKDSFMDDVTTITLSYTFFEKKKGS